MPEVTPARLARLLVFVLVLLGLAVVFVDVQRSINEITDGTGQAPALAQQLIYMRGVWHVLLVATIGFAAYIGTRAMGD